MYVDVSNKKKTGQLQVEEVYGAEHGSLVLVNQV